MLPIAIITDEICQDFDRSLDLMREWGVDLAEVRTVNGRNVSQLSDAELASVRDALDSRGLRACCVASPFYKCELPDSSVDQHPGGFPPGQEAVLERCLRAAQVLGAPGVRVFAFWRRGPSTPQVMERAAGFFYAPLEAARAAGVSLWLENEHDCYVSSGEEARDFIRRFSTQTLRALWDPANVLAYGKAPYPSDYEAVKGEMAHLHLKDAARDPSGKLRWVAVGEGEVDYARLLRSLVSDRYRGILSLETHFSIGDNTEASTKASLDGVRRLLDAL